jgi:hypothetical protein
MLAEGDPWHNAYANPKKTVTADMDPAFAFERLPYNEAGFRIYPVKVIGDINVFAQNATIANLNRSNCPYKDPWSDINIVPNADPWVIVVTLVPYEWLNGRMAVNTGVVPNAQSVRR